jgi:hypothetical protein
VQLPQQSACVEGMGKQESALSSQELTRLPPVASVFAIPEQFWGDGVGGVLAMVIVTE